MSLPLHRKRCNCGKYADGPAALYCKTCLEKRRKRTYIQQHAEVLTDRTIGLYQQLLPVNPVTYSTASLLWKMPLRETIAQVNALVRAGKLHGTGKRGEFLHVVEEDLSHLAPPDKRVQERAREGGKKNKGKAFQKRPPDERREY